MCFCFVLSGSNIRNPAHAVLIKMLSKLGFDLDFSFFLLFFGVFVCVGLRFRRCDSARDYFECYLCFLFFSSLDTARFLFEHRENAGERVPIN